MPGDELGNESRNFRRSLQAWEMSRARHFTPFGARDDGRDMAAAFLNVGEVEIAPYQEGRHRDIAKPVVEGPNVDVRSERGGAECDAVHVEEQIASGTRDTTFGRQRSIQPETCLHRVQAIEVA